MRPAIRVQADYDVQEASDEATWHPDPDEEPNTRQEFRDDCDVNKILQRGGIPIHTQLPTYGDINYNDDLDHYIQEVRRADTLFSQLPAELRDEYRNRNNLIQALDNGQISAKLDEWLKAKPQEPNNPIAELNKWLKAQTIVPASSSANAPGSPSAAAAGTPRKTPAENA